MTEQRFSWNRYEEMPIVGILRNVSPEYLTELVKNYSEAGFTTLEITMNSPGASEMINGLTQMEGQPLNIGAGTVCSMEALHQALDAGAQFIVTPIVHEEIIKACVKQEIPVFAGAYTPTEIYKAWSAGASLVKIFPAGKLGPAFVKDVLAPLNEIKLLPTGGVTLDNFTEFLKAGARGVGIGSHLIPIDYLEKHQWKQLSSHLGAFVKKYRIFKKDEHV